MHISPVLLVGAYSGILSQNIFETPFQICYNGVKVIPQKNILMEMNFMKSKYLSKRYWKDQSTPMGKVNDLAKQFDDVIDLSLGDPDITTHDIIIENAFEDAKAGHTKYTDFRGDPELRSEIVKFYDEEYEVPVNDSEVMVTASGCIAMYLVMEAILDDGDEVIMHAPFFTPYPQQVELARGIPVILDTFEDEDFQVNIERLEGLITERTKAIVINTPNNPSGTCFTKETMNNVAEIAKKHDLLVIADDIYGSYSYQEPFIPLITLEGMRERTITINSFSKDFTMTGWRVGNIIAPDYIIKVIQQINENVVFTAPSISQRAAIHALRNRTVIQPTAIEEYRKRVFYAADRINNIPKLSVLSPKGTFYLFVNIKEMGLTSAEASELILNEAHVLGIPGNAFGDCGEGYLRFACTVNTESLKEAFDRIEKMDIFNK
jgi:aspartate/methionine/tyrosine aminotransferase